MERVSGFGWFLLVALLTGMIRRHAPTADALVPEQLWQAIQPLPPTRQLGCGSPVTCWRRLRDWQRAGVWRQLHHLLLDELGREVGWTGRGPAWTRSACGPSGRPRKRPVRLHLDKAYDYPAAGGRCAGAGSRPGSPVVASSPAGGWAATAPRWSGPWPAR